MKRRRALLLALLSILVVCTVCGSWLHQESQRYGLSRQLIAALLRKDTQAALALVDSGADPNTRLTPSPQPDLENLLDRLLHGPPPPDTKSPTAFQIVCGAFIEQHKAGKFSEFRLPQEHAPLVNAMLDRGANVAALGPYQATALHTAVEAKFRHIVEQLLQHGAEVNVQSSVGLTPLMHTISNDDADMARLLLANKANPNVEGGSGRTALFYAVDHAITFGGEIKLISELLAHGADCNLVEQDGGTPLAYTRRSKRFDLVRLMQRPTK